ncbi:MAG TPA: hypothetical protein VNY83_00210 [Solirubrobacterales bacterium]|nr:hypothetical protein [Solirubrobacterales bacterium]
MRAKRLLTAGLAVALLGLASAGSALACSCAPASPSESLARADAAIVGRLVSVVPHGSFHAEYRYRIKRVYRGKEEIEPGQILSVLSASRASACALPRRMGRRYGLFLLRGGQTWASGMCGVISPRRLWLAARHQPRVYRRPAALGSGCS